MEIPQPDLVPASTAARGLVRRLLRGFLLILCSVLILGMTGWMALAISYSDLHSTPPRFFLGGVISLGSLAGVIAFRKRRVSLLAFAFVFAGVLIWFLRLQPSNDRDWAPEVAVLPYAEINGDRIHLHNIRNFAYRSETDFTPTYDDRTFDLSRLQSIDLILSYWAGPAIAHALLSFGFDDGQQVAISIETRKEKSESYSTVQGFFRQYELIYVVADERDLIRLRTNYRGEEVYLYRLPAPPQKARAVFLDYLRVVNSLKDRPQFYNALTENCTTSLFGHLRCAPPIPPFTIGVLLSGYSARYGYERGGLNYGVSSFDELQQRSRINDLAKPADKAADFSRRIRANLILPKTTPTSNALSATPTDTSRPSAPLPSRPWPDGMVWIPGGEFTMGTDDVNSMPNEQPAHRVRLDGFWMDTTAVTNEQFRAFVKATGYLTTAERPVDWEELKNQVPPGTPKPADEMLKPGSLVFTPPDQPVDLRDMSGWWTWTIGANWQHPQGPASSIDDKDEFPVCQVGWDDAVAYAKWAGKRLPTEAEWEFAAHGNATANTRYGWGDEFRPGGKFMANTFTGVFPHKNTAEDGFARAAPVNSFPPNGYGLYDMGGNVWNWTADLYRADTHATAKSEGVCYNPAGPQTSMDPVREVPTCVERVIKGGSFLCHPSYCESYRPTARRGTPPDTGSEHVGFRCVLSKEEWDRQRGF